MCIPALVELAPQARCQRGKGLGFGAAGLTSRKMRFEVEPLGVVEQFVQFRKHVTPGLFVRESIHGCSSFNRARNRSRAWFRREWTVPTGIPSISATSATGRSW